MLIVFQCAGCRNIVGDSTEWLKAIPGLGLILLGKTAAEAVAVGPPGASKGQDRQTKTRDLSCMVCGQHIGYFYDEKQGNNPEVEGAYALLLPLLLSYRVDPPAVSEPGSQLESQLGRQTAPQTQPSRPEPTPETAPEIAAEEAEQNSEDQPALEKRVQDLESLVMYLFSKVQS